MDLTNDIISFLFTYRKLNLPGLGLLELIKTSAKRNIAKNKIIGPEFNLKFYDNKYDNDIFENFISFISSKYNISTRKSEDKIRKYSLELLNNIANYGSATIDNLGSFSRKNDKLHFELSPVLSEIIKESYPDYSLPFIKREIEKTKTPVVAPVYDNKKVSSNNNWIFPFIILTISSIIIVCMIYCFSNLLNPDTGKVMVKDTTNSNESKTIPQDTSEAFPFEKEVPDSIIKSQEIPSNESSDSLNTEKTDQKTDTIPEKISLEELIKMAPELRTKYEKTCIIITGSFIRKYNARRMIKRLKKDGFSPYSERYGRFHRTGVLFDCNKKPLREFLDELRHSVDKESWVLKWK